MEGYLSVSEAAERLGVSRQMVLSLVKRGKLRADRLGSAVAVLEADVEARMKAPKDQGGRPRKES